MKQLLRFCCITTD